MFCSKFRDFPATCELMSESIIHFYEAIERFGDFFEVFEGLLRFIYNFHLIWGGIESLRNEKIFKFLWKLYKKT